MKFRRSLLLIFAVLALAAAPVLAGDFGEKTLVGSWEFDFMQMMKAQVESTGQPMPPGMEEMMKDAYMRIHFDKDGTFRYEMNSPMGLNEDSGTWKVTESKDGTITVVATGQDENDTQEFKITFSDEDAFEAVSGQQGMDVTMRAKRMKGEKSE